MKAGWTKTAAPVRGLAEGQRAYEARRAEKAGMTLDEWLQSKERRQAAERTQMAPVPSAPAAPRKKGLMARLIDRAHQPLKPPTTRR